jgi:flagellar hook-associated protein 3 FlgL
MQTTLDAASELFLTNVARIQQRLADANQQVSSGKKILQASDAPDEIDSLLQLRADRQHNQQVQSNLALAKTDAQAADDALGSSIELMDRALVLGAQGANSGTDPNSRQSLAQEVRSLLDQMVVYSRTAVQGRYIFSGDQDGQPAYVSDPTAVNGVTQLQAVTSTRQVEDASGGTFAAVKGAPDIFDLRNSDGTVAAGNVFAALSGLNTALAANDTDAISQAISAIKTAATHLNTMQSFYGTVQNRIQDATDFAGQYDTRLQTELSQKEDADVTAAALEAQQANTQLQAAFQMRAALPHKSLFDYLG